MSTKDQPALPASDVSKSPDVCEAPDLLAVSAGEGRLNEADLRLADQIAAAPLSQGPARIGHLARMFREIRAASPSGGREGACSREQEAAYAEVVAAAYALICAVEGADVLPHGVWRDSSGMRLKDTREWVALCNAVSESRVPEAAPVAPPVSREGFDFIAFLRRQRALSERAFGPLERKHGVVDHIRKELVEIEAAPRDLEEWIDVVLLALDGAWRCDASPDAIVAMLDAKLSKNEKRDWPDFRDVPEGKAIEHVRAAAPVAPVPPVVTEEMVEAAFDETRMKAEFGGAFSYRPFAELEPQHRTNLCEFARRIASALSRTEAVQIKRLSGPSKSVFWGGNNKPDSERPDVSLVLESDLRALEARAAVAVREVTDAMVERGFDAWLAHINEANRLSRLEGEVSRHEVVRAILTAALATRDGANG